MSEDTCDEFANETSEDNKGDVEPSNFAKEVEAVIERPERATCNNLRKRNYQLEPGTCFIYTWVNKIANLFFSAFWSVLKNN